MSRIFIAGLSDNRWMSPVVPGDLRYRGHKHAGHTGPTGLWDLRQGFKDGRQGQTQGQNSRNPIENRFLTVKNGKSMLTNHKSTHTNRG